MNVWGIHMGEHVGSDPIDNGYVALGWHKLGDLTELATSRKLLKAALAEKIEYERPGAIPVHAGELYRFVSEMEVGDIIVYPSKADRMINIGRVTGSYQFIENDPHEYPNHRKVDWLISSPRTDFKQAALNEIGSALAFFMVSRHADYFLSSTNLGKSPGESSDDTNDFVDDETATSSIAIQAEESTSDFIIKQLHTKLDGYEFEHFVAHVLGCIGYHTRVSTKSGDGGVDVIAHNDELGFEPPIIKVQCKRSIGQNSEPEVSQLLGTLGEGEYALFVNLGSYSKPARVLERNKSKLRLIDGEELVNLVLEHYSKMSPKYRTLLPMKQIYVPDLG